MLRRLFHSLLLLSLLLVACRNMDKANQELITAASRVNNNNLIKLLDAGADPNTRRHGNETALGLLIQQYKRSHQDRRKRIEDAATELLDCGADANALHHGFTPLQIATGQGSEVIVSRLITYGADPNLKTRAGLAPIWQAVFDNNYKIGLILLQAGANPNALNTQEQTPMQHLQSRGYQKTKLMLYLRQYGGK